jgi:hypothetical protein
VVTAKSSIFYVVIFRSNILAVTTESSANFEDITYEFPILSDVIDEFASFYVVTPKSEIF